MFAPFPLRYPDLALPVGHDCFAVMSYVGKGCRQKSADGDNSGVVLEKVCEYLYYNEKYKGVKDVPDMDIPPELCLELLMAADYLNGR